jgi:hypothetical protein
MTTARVERMIREIQSEPMSRFFDWLMPSERPGRQAAGLDAVAPQCLVAAFVAQRVQRGHDDRMAVHFEKAA